MKNAYNLAVYKKENQPVFVVTIKHSFRAGTYFFKTMQEARDYVTRAKTELEPYGKLTYDPDMKIFAGVIDIVLYTPEIKVGENGRTFWQN